MAPRTYQQFSGGGALGIGVLRHLPMGCRTRRSAWALAGKAREAEFIDADQTARVELVRMLQDAHAGEWAAAYAYRGHWKSLRRRRPEEADEIQRIEEAEWHHRHLVRVMLDELGERPRRGRELLMGAIGRFFGALCWVSFWFAPMYAAGRLEFMNVGQYEFARDRAQTLGLDGYATQLEAMRVEELRHEIWFGDRIRGHRLLPWAARVWKWTPGD